MVVGISDTLKDNCAFVTGGQMLPLPPGTRPDTASFDSHGGCFIETGFGKAGYGSGDFFAEPVPAENIRPRARRWHLGEVAFEYKVMRRWL